MPPKQIACSTLYGSCISVIIFLLSILPASARTLEINTSEVTAPDVTVSPDGKTILFTMLGHIFLLPEGGGTAEQLTSGPGYHSDPEFSPDGSQIVFVSDRVKDKDSLFILNLADREVRQITKEEEAGRPVWSRDGKSILYLSFVRRPGLKYFPAAVKRIPVSGGEPETILPADLEIRSVFITQNGEIGYGAIKEEDTFPGIATQIEIIQSKKKGVQKSKIAGYADRIVASPKGEGFYAYRYLPEITFGPITEDLIHVTTDGKEEQLVPVGNDSTSKSRFGVTSDESFLYFGHAGRIWRLSLSDGIRQVIPFRAQVKVEVAEVTKPGPRPAQDDAPTIAGPCLSPDQAILVFQAAGYLWRQSLPDGKAERITAENGLEGSPSFSPEGKLAFVHRQLGQNAIRVLDLKTGLPETILSGTSGYSQISWSGNEMVFVESKLPERNIVKLNLNDGRIQKLIPVDFWAPAPRFSNDQKYLYFSANRDGIGQLYRLSTEKMKEEPVAATGLDRHLSRAQISPDEKWMAFQRNKEIWIAEMRKGLIREQDVRQISKVGGDNFSFAPDSSALIYSSGNRLWRQSIATAEKTEIRINLNLAESAPQPVMLRNARILDFHTGGFTDPMSLLIRNREIEWMGSESGREVPPDATVVDAAGRFVIPGLFDMHVHADWVDPQIFLAYGITSVRDTGGGLTNLNMLRDRGEKTLDPAPRYFFSGEIFEGFQPYLGDFFLKLDREDEAREYVRRFKDGGADFIKVYPSLPWDLQTAVTEEARRLGLPVIGHGVYIDEFVKGITRGYWTLEHAPSILQPRMDVLQLMAQAGARWDITLSVDGGAALLLRDEPERLHGEKFEKFVPQVYVDMARTSSYYKSVSDQEMRGMWMDELASALAAHRAGVKLLIGTDAPNPEVFFGPSLHWEMEHFVQAGLTPIEVLQIATREAAATVGADRLGGVIPGNLADLLVLERNPLEDIRNTQTIWRVIQDGNVYDPASFGER